MGQRGAHIKQKKQKRNRPRPAGLNHTKKKGGGDRMGCSICKTGKPTLSKKKRAGNVNYSSIEKKEEEHQEGGGSGRGRRGRTPPHNNQEKKKKKKKHTTHTQHQKKGE